MSRMMSRMRTLLLVTLVCATFAAACDGATLPTLPDGATVPTLAGGTPGTTAGEAPDPTNAPDPTDAPDSTQAPDTTNSPDTSAPDTTPAADTDESSTAPWWILILIGVALLLLIVSFAARGNKNKVVTATPSVKTWKDFARAGYADARWLYDGMGEDMALWRGNAQFEGTTDVGATAGTSRAETWRELSGRLDRARDNLYALEAAAPDPATAEMARATVTTMLDVRSALDARAESRFAYRTAEAAATETSSNLTEARDREVRASTNFNRAKSDYAKALTNLSTII